MRNGVINFLDEKLSKKLKIFLRNFFIGIFAIFIKFQVLNFFFQNKISEHFSMLSDSPEKIFLSIFHQTKLR
jgi:hypothetical protein